MYGTSAGICPVHNTLAINTGCVGLPGINIPPLQTALTPPFPSPVGSISNQWAGGFGSPTIPTPVPMASLFHTTVLPQSTLNHLINLQQHPLMIHQMGGGIAATSVLSTGSSCSASISGSSSSRTHTLGNFSKSSVSVASDTKDNNGEPLCALSVMDSVILKNEYCQQKSRRYLKCGFLCSFFIFEQQYKLFIKSCRKSTD
jgi:hypothetical protein